MAKLRDLQHAEVDDGVFVVELPEDGDGEGADAEDEHPDDEGRAEPVVDLAAVEEDFEACGAEADEGDADAVDAELAGFPSVPSCGRSCALRRRTGGSCTKRLVRKRERMPMGMLMKKTQRQL